MKMLLAVISSVFLVVLQALNAGAFEVTSVGESVTFAPGQKKATIPIPEDIRLCDVASPLCITLCATAEFSVWGMERGSDIIFQKNERSIKLVKQVEMHPDWSFYCVLLCGCELWQQLKKSGCDMTATDRRIFVELSEVATPSTPTGSHPVLFMALEQTHQNEKKTDALGIASVLSVPIAGKCVLEDSVKSKFVMSTAKAVADSPPQCYVDEKEATHHIFESEQPLEGEPLSAEVLGETWKVTPTKRTDTRSPLLCAGPSTPEKMETKTTVPVGTPSASESSLFAVVKAGINVAQKSPTVLRFRLRQGQSLCDPDMPPCLTACLSGGLKISKVELRTNTQQPSLMLPTKKILVDGGTPQADCGSICACDLYAAMKKQPNTEWCQASSFDLLVTPTNFERGDVVGFVTSSGILSEPEAALRQVVTAGSIPASLLRCEMNETLGVSVDVRYIIADKFKRGTPPDCQTARPGPHSGMFYEIWSTTHNNWLLSPWFAKSKITGNLFDGFNKYYKCYSRDWTLQAHSVAKASDGTRSVINFQFPNTAKGLSSWNPCSIKDPVCIGICYPSDVQPTKVELLVPGANSPVMLKTSVVSKGSGSDEKVCSIACGCAVFEALRELDAKAICKPVATNKGDINITVTLGEGSLSKVDAIIVSGGSKTLMAGESRITGSTTLTSFLQDAPGKVCVSERAGLTPSYVRKTSTVSLQSATTVPVCQKEVPVKNALENYWVVWSRAPVKEVTGHMTTDAIAMSFISPPESLLRCQKYVTEKVRGKPVKDKTTAQKQKLVATFFRFQNERNGLTPKKVDDNQTAFEVKLEPKEAAVLCSAKTPFIFNVVMNKLQGGARVFLVLNKKAPIPLNLAEFYPEEGAQAFTVGACPVWEVFQEAGSCTVTSVELLVKHSGVPPSTVLYLISGSQIPSTVKQGENVTVALDTSDVAVWMPPTVQCRSAVKHSEIFRIASSQKTQIPRCLEEGYGPNSGEQLVGSAYIISGKKPYSNDFTSTFSCDAPSASSTLPVFSHYTVVISSILGFWAAFSPLYGKHDKTEC